MNSSKTYRSQVYRDFQELEETAWHSITRFYEERERTIVNLEFKEYFELLLCYTNALFEIGAYRKHIRMANQVIEISIFQNIHLFQGQDIYYGTLFRKAASHYNLMHYNKCSHILRELIKLNPLDSDNSNFLKRCLRSQYPEYIKKTRAVAVFMFLITALIICVEVLLISNFYPFYEPYIMLIRNIIFGVGVAILAGGDLYHRWDVNQKVDGFVKEVIHKKMNTL